eukprot:CAMPEP_0170594466 /NCGR_PEP_ID=MMETSP0224-20130122/14017_1 /TAXON_ID=285029 /ORGANISM="Togula jolla, Strain CCCM 725" /LENGTH=101 /DNA_ID=CAMNT_0010918529 /DNA_START=149 /DNA_END=455 /DNA_ORIENTATION=+
MSREGAPLAGGKRLKSATLRFPTGVGVGVGVRVWLEIILVLLLLLRIFHLAGIAILILALAATQITAPSASAADGVVPPRELLIREDLRVAVEIEDHWHVN